MKSSLLVLFFVLSKSFAEEVLLDIDQGRLSGTVQYDRKGSPFYSFLSIPFAKPPIGELRFKDPEPADPWTGVLDATQDLPKCFQMNYTTLAPEGQEDCLYLNVYTKSITGSSPKPVMVWIHGGAFQENAGRQDLYSPEFLMTEEIVLVTINYRLLIFGSFSLEDASYGTPGNAGLKDQSLAFKWVKENIASFGGDKDSVTIFGQSAGGASVHYHILSPRSEGLFDRAIMQSGVAIASWTFGVQNNGFLVANALGVPTNNTEAMLAILRSLTPLEIYAGWALASQAPGSGSLSGPVIETQEDGTAFLTKNPYDTITSGEYQHIPMIIGYNDAEGISADQANRFLQGNSTLIEDFASMIPLELDVEVNTKISEDLANDIKRFYYGSDEPSLEDMIPFIQIYTDLLFGFPSYRAAATHVKNAKEAVYFYRFSMDTVLNVYKRRDPISATYHGASHSDDIGYLFNSWLTPEVPPGSIEDLCVDRMVKLWTNFAKYGTPTPAEFNVQWLPVTSETFNYLDIGTRASIARVDPDAENMKFWNDIYTKYYRGSASIANGIAMLLVTSVLATVLIV